MPDAETSREIKYMKIINPSLIKEKATNAAVYERGNNLFMDERVGRIEIAFRGQKTYEIAAKVRGSTGSTYYAQATVAFFFQGELIKDYTCDCAVCVSIS